MNVAMQSYPKLYLYRRIVQAKLYIDNHYGQKLDLDNIADEATFSKFHFLRLFKATYGKSPHQYLAWVRVERAKLLLKTNIAIREVCLEVGFESISSFTTRFKRQVGIPPAAYRQIQERTRRTPLKFIPHCFAEANGWMKAS